MNRPIRGQRRAGRWALGVTVAATAIFAVGCGSSSSDKSSSGGGSSSSGSTIPVGILHSLSGTMAISEVSVRDSELLAIDEINKAGGVLGKQLKPVIEDGASDWPTFAEKAQKLISTDHVAATFGGWTSASRKAMLPVFERNKAL
ncbi:MAG TPA: transporter substrate-binding protein, partial [Solirubrobacteraceae bacterium]|nr:transporter substrate-binding protein [Solirubrobacteraceae bacterium]